MTSHPSTVLPLATNGLRYEKFDPSNAEHRKAFAMIVQDKRQHPTLRFNLEHPFVNVREMMLNRVAAAYIAVMDAEAMQRELLQRVAA